MLDTILGWLLPRDILHWVKGALKNMTPAEKAIADKIVSGFVDPMITEVTAALVGVTDGAAKAEAYVQARVNGGKSITKG